tara:strand:+ start:14272 stop:14643 length:372 start_codon:yes stop_codon:yes gene_type:complete
MKSLSLLLLLTLTITSCNTTNKSIDTKNNTEQEMDSKKMIANGYLAGKISISTEEGDCPTTILIEGKNGAYYYDPINLSEDFNKDGAYDNDGEKVWIKFSGLRRMNRCDKASPIHLNEIVKNN